MSRPLAPLLMDALALFDEDRIDENDETEHPAAFSLRALAAELRVSPSLAKSVIDLLKEEGRITPLKAHGSIVYSRRQDGDIPYGAVNRVVPVLHPADQHDDETTTVTNWLHTTKAKPAPTLGAKRKRAWTP